MLVQPHASLEGDILYFIEHQFLKDEFYSNTANLLNISVENLFNYIKSVFEGNNCDFNFKLEDFNIEYYLYDKTYTMIISFPKTNYATLCDRIYLLFDPEKNKKMYFTIERGIFDPSGFLCSWTENNVHVNHNEIESLDWIEEEKNNMKNIEKYIILSIFDDDNNEMWIAKTQL